MTSLSRSLVLACALWLSPTFARADVVADWTKTALDTVAASGEHLSYRLQAMAMVHVAMFEALNFIEGRYTPHFVVIPPMPAGMSPEAAVAGAAHHVLAELYPNQRVALAAALNASLDAIENDQAKVGSLVTGKSIAGIICALRLTSRTDPPTSEPLSARVSYGSVPAPVDASRPKLETWMLETAQDFRPAPPPGLNSRVGLRTRTRSER